MKNTLFHLLTLLIAAFSIPVYAQNPRLTEGFKRADRNGDGKLSADEENQLPQLKTKLQGSDKDGDGVITFDEFRVHLVAGAGPPSTRPSPATKLTAGEHTRTIAVGDLQRRYRVHVPAKYDAANPTPVVIVSSWRRRKSREHGAAHRHECEVGRVRIHCRVSVWQRT